MWPRNFKLEKLKKYDGKENPENWITLYEIAVRSAAGDEHVMTNYFSVVLDQASHQWLLGLPRRLFRLLGRTVPSVYRQFRRYLRAAREQIRPRENKG